MATKLQRISDIMDQTVRQITNSQIEWMEYLKTSARLYKYPFQKQILIFAQRPDATACATIEFWNKTMRRWVNRGAKGIALIDDSGEKTTLKHVFDVSDTHSLRHVPFQLWKMKEAYLPQVIEELSDQFGEPNDTYAGFESQLVDIVENAVEDNYLDYLSELLKCRAGSYLGELDEQNVRVLFKEVLAESVSYCAFSRMGLDMQTHRFDDAFSGVFNLNTFDTVMQLGSAVSDISEMVLRQAERTIKSIKRQVRDTLAKSAELKDNELDSGKERSIDHGNNVYEAGRLPHTESDTGRNGDEADREVRDAEEDVSESAQEGNILGDDIVREAGQPFGRYRPDGEGAGGADGAGVVEDEPGTGQSGGSDGVDAVHEQSEASGGGSGAGGADLQLNLPTESEQIERIVQAEDDESSAFSVSQQNIDHVLLLGGNVEYGKIRIYQQYQKNATAKENIKFLKDEYGIGGGSVSFPDGTDGFEWHDAKGIRITVGRIGVSDYDVPLTWAKVNKRIGELIEAERYMSQSELDAIPKYEQWLLQRQQKAIEERAALNEQYQRLVKARAQGRYNLTLGNMVFVENREYSILAVEDELITLFDPDCPLINREMTRDAFMRELRGSARNDYLLDLDAVDETDKESKVQPEVGMEVELEGRTFVIDSINEDNGKASLRDLTFEQTSGFPIFRSENIEVVRHELANQPVDDSISVDAENDETTKSDADTDQPEEASLHPAWEKTSNGEVAEAIVPTVQQLINYRITNDELGHGGAKAKYGFNVAAIRTLKQIERENRMATPEEQEVLSKYVGWGGLPQAFDEANTGWSSEYAELKQLLTEDEYASARESTLNAHYTSPIVIKVIYQAVENMGFQTGNVLEPACGIGNFLGLVSESMKDVKMYGVELDSITGRIAKQLYQKASIAVEGYEKTSLPDSFFDLAIGNVPFGSYGVADKRYDKNHFLIHDYFFAKTLDKVRPGGIIAFITSKGTMDKKNSAVRKYIAQRAELIGAVRLPNNAFLANAGTQVTSDILFLQKRDRLTDIEPDWVHLGQTEDGLPANSYFADNPDMVLGTMTHEDRMYGNRSDTTCTPFPDADLADQLRIAIENIHAEITEYDREDIEEAEDVSVPADPEVHNFSYTLVDGEIYYRENSRMNKAEVSKTAANRIKGMIEIRDCTRRLIEYQLEGYADEAVEREQSNLNALYDTYTKKYGLLNSRANNMAFSDDSSYCLLCSLEIIDENGELERKADMFAKRTIKQNTAVTSVDTVSEALAVSISEKACVDVDFMGELAGVLAEELTQELAGVIFLNPVSKRYETADEYLSGNVREKLNIAREFAENDLAYAPNVEALESVQPKNLTAGEIDVRLGATWMPPDDVEQFVLELLKPGYYARNRIKVHFSPYTAAWNIEGKNADYDNVAANVTYGTERINAYKIIEETLNLKDVRIFDKKVDADGKETRVLKRQATMIAQQKQQQIKEAFQDWIWKDADRRERLVTRYNERFNSIRPREYDGSHIRFSGMNPEITLKPHQVNAVARILYGGNTLLAHVVGAGKTFEMVAAAMESKWLGLCNKSLFAVPNHLTEQWASEFLQLYPSANILVATKKDFQMRNRKKFCGRIATGDYDAVIIGHSQFEKIPMSIDRQRRLLEDQLYEITGGIQELKENRGERYSIKQMEKVKKSLKLKLDKLNDTERKDDLVTFEELGVDRLYVDEAHAFKNLFLYTKMRNVAGLAQTEAQKSSDLFMKCRYMDELTGGRGVVFATGTPISNSMTELYTMQRYLQYGALKTHGLQHFDAWASTFGETITAIELAPEGTGYRAKTRFARFYNLPELLSMFKQVADIQTADMLDLPVPEAQHYNVVIKPSEHQRNMVAEFADRAEKVRNGMVEATEDNMLKITNDGRKLALDQRLANELLPDDTDSKVSNCADNIYSVWERNRDGNLTQLVFCDLSTPHYDDSFNVYDDIKSKLMDKGVPEDEVAFIHDANTEARKSELFSNVRKGQVRILLGSTFKMGAGTNVQDKLVALHHLDVPWRPSDIEQREGRIIRQGNGNDQVHIYRYVTENTFDSYMWQTIENKQKFISQIMTSKSPVRSCEDIDETALSYAEVKALATGNPHIKEKMDLDIQVARLKLLKANHLSQRYAMEDNLNKTFPTQIRLTEERISGYEQDIAHVNEFTVDDGEKFSSMVISGIQFEEKELAGKALLDACKRKTSPEPAEIGAYLGFKMMLSFDTFGKRFQLALKNVLSHSVDLGTDVFGNISRIDNVLAGLPKKLEHCKRNLEDLHRQVETAMKEVDKPFPQEQELKEKTERLAELDILLNMDKSQSDGIDAQPEAEETTKQYGRAR